MSAIAMTKPKSKRKVRKEMGVFYTPKPVAEFLVERALEVWAETAGPSWEEARLLDPACGAGVFLESASEALSKRLVPSPDRQLFGIDIDPKAIEQAKRGCLRVGDFLQDSTLVDGLFDIVIGNPPYHRERGHKLKLDAIAQTELGCYRSARMDLWHYFVHRSLSLLRPGGILAFLVNSYWTASSGARPLVESLRTETQMVEIWDLANRKIFPGVSGHHMMFIARKGEPGGATKIAIAEPDSDFPPRFRIFEKPAELLYRQGKLDLTPPGHEFAIIHHAKFVKLGDQVEIRQGIAENPARISRRLNERFGRRWTVGEGVFVLTPEEVERLNLSDQESALIKPYWALADIQRYDFSPGASLRLIESTRESWPDHARETHPRLLRHLERFRPIMDERRETRLGCHSWFHLHWPRDASLWMAPRKIICKQMAAQPCFALAETSARVSFSANVILPKSNSADDDLDYFLGLLNSSTIKQWFQSHAKARGVGLDINGHVLRQVPIPLIKPGDSRSSIRNEIVSLVRSIYDAHQHKRSEIDAGRIWTLDNLIRDADHRLDDLVAQLYSS